MRLLVRFFGFLFVTWKPCRIIHTDVNREAL